MENKIKKEILEGFQFLIGKLSHLNKASSILETAVLFQFLIGKLSRKNMEIKNLTPHVSIPHR